MAKDERYKVDQQMIDSMRELRRSTNASYQKIADAFGVSYFTAYYWINNEFRSKHRGKVAKRRYAPKDSVRIKRDMNKRKKNWADSPKTKLRHKIQSAKNEKRHQRKTVDGMEIDQALKLLQSGKLSTSNKKVRD